MINTLAYFNMEVAALLLVGMLVMFGGKKIPELMRGIGQGVGELKKGMEDGKTQLMNSIHHESTTPSTVTSQPAASISAGEESKVASPAV